MPDHYIAWWNVENLFDHATATRPDYLRSKLRGELVGWTASVRDAKIAQLASVITQMNNQKGPDILGVCEIENATVMTLLAGAMARPGRNYAVLHHDMSDNRGIDIAFIYDANLYTPDPTNPWFSYEVLKRSATRDVFQANFDTAQGRRLILIGNHWPARLGAAEYRVVAGETLSYWLERIADVVGGEPSVLVMGDFNDEPFNRSLTDFALSSRTTRRVLNGRNPYLFNLMWPLMGAGDTSYVYDNRPNMLDQFLVTKAMLRQSPPIRVLRDSVQVIRLPGMTAGQYNIPRRFGRPAKAASFDPTGFSDHLPIAVTLREA
jgi:predicted extracellular nuclease